MKYFDYDTKNKRQALIDMRVRPVGIDLSIANIAYITTSKSISQEKFKVVQLLIKVLNVCIL